MSTPARSLTDYDERITAKADKVVETARECGKAISYGEAIDRSKKRLGCNGKREFAKPDLDDPSNYDTLQGRKHIKFTALLELALWMGLDGVETRVIQIPSKENLGVAVMHARVTMSDGSFFEGVGDADGTNCNTNIAQHRIRMAETRAIGRALRMATGRGDAFAEELGGGQ